MIKMTCKKKKRKRKYLGLTVAESPTLQDLIRERKEQKRNQDEYFL